MISFVRCDSRNKDFIELVRLLDANLQERNGAIQVEYSPHNVLGSIGTVVVAYEGDFAVGCGCFRPHGENTVEMKRMFVRPEYRGQGIAKGVLGELEIWARELGYARAVLETGQWQTEALRLYPRCGYQRIANYEPYTAFDTSICFGKTLDQ